MEVKSIQELEEVLNSLEPDRQVDIATLEGKEILLQGTARKSEQVKAVLHSPVPRPRKVSGAVAASRP